MAVDDAGYCRDSMMSIVVSAVISSMWSTSMMNFRSIILLIRYWPSAVRFRWLQCGGGP